jgi:hypothetical protein
VWFFTQKYEGVTKIYAKSSSKMMPIYYNANTFWMFLERTCFLNDFSMKIKIGRFSNKCEIENIKSP